MENISRKSDSGFASAVQKPNTASDSVEEDSGESVKSEDREQLNSFQEKHFLLLIYLTAILINCFSQIF
jgi:hypothetical protein